MQRRTLKPFVISLIALSLLASGAWSQPKQPKKRALLIGVSTYTKAGLADKPLPFAASDMQDLAIYLKGAKWDVTALTSKGTQNNATRKNILEWLQKTLDGIDADDLVMVAFSGHGQQFRASVKVDDASPPVQQDEAFLCPSDAEPGEPSTLIGMTELLRMLEKKGGRNLVLVDACRDDPRRSAGVAGNAGRNIPANTAILFSCAARQQSYETNQMYGKDSKDGHGIFFWHVRKAIEGEATNDQGLVTWDRLSEYVRNSVNDDAVKWFPERVNVNARGEKEVQTPHVIGSLVGRSPVLAEMDAEGTCRIARAYLLNAKNSDGRKRAFEMFQKAVQRGSAQAAYWLSEMHLSGYESNPIDTERAKQLLKQASDGGYSPAQVCMGIRLKRGSDGFEKDEKAGNLLIQQASASVRKLADAGDPVAQDEFGNMCYWGYNAVRSYAAAVKWYAAAAEQGYARGQCNLADMYRFGVGVKDQKKDIPTAVKWYQKAIDQGMAHAQLQLASLYFVGIETTRDQKAGVALYRKAADQGHTYAQVLLGHRYYGGEGVTKNFAEAFKWYQKASELGDVDGHYNVAYMYEHGEGTQKNEREALRLYQLAVDKGHAQAQDALGTMYYDGRGGLAENHAMAFQLYQKSAAQGCAKGMFNFGYMFEYGKGVQANQATAIEWYKKAAAKKDAEAITALRRLGITP